MSIISDLSATNPNTFFNQRNPEWAWLGTVINLLNMETIINDDDLYEIKIKFEETLKVIQMQT
jgi:hypothetical protein